MKKYLSPLALLFIASCNGLGISNNVANAQYEHGCQIQSVSNENNLSKEELEKALERETLVRELDSNITINNIKEHTVNENFQCFKKVRSLVEGTKHFSNPKSQLNFLIDWLNRYQSNIVAEHLYAAVAIEWEVLAMALCHYVKDINKRNC